MKFWDIDPQELETMEEDRIYPPRFEIQVCGSQASELVNAAITFRGMDGRGPDTTELLLEPTSEGVLKCFPSSCSCSIICCSLNLATGGTASMRSFHPLSAYNSRSEPILRFTDSPAVMVSLHLALMPGDNNTFFLLCRQEDKSNFDSVSLRGVEGT